MYSLIKTIANEVKVGVIITDIILTMYVLWLIVTNTSHWIPGVIFGYSLLGIWLLLRANKLFHLCLLHKLMLWHSTAIYACCIYQAYYSFGEYLSLFRWTMFISGILLIIMLFNKRCKV